MLSLKVKIAALVISAAILAAIIGWYVLKPKQSSQNLNAGASVPITLPKKASPSAQKSKVSSPSAQPSSQLALDDFSQWAVLENYSSGYRLIYPSIFNIDYSGNPIVIKPATGAGAVKLTLSGKSVSVQVDTSGTSDAEAILINKAANLVGSTFEYITSLGYSLNDAAFRLANDK